MKLCIHPAMLASWPCHIRDRPMLLSLAWLSPHSQAPMSARPLLASFRAELKWPHPRALPCVRWYPPCQSFFFFFFGFFFFFNSDRKSQKLYSSSSVHSVPCCQSFLHPFSWHIIIWDSGSQILAEILLKHRRLALLIACMVQWIWGETQEVAALASS